MNLKGKYETGDAVLDGWREEVLTGKGPELYRCGAGELERIEIGPKLVTLIGGAPAAGKTAFTMQLVMDALRMTPTLRAVVCNVEMPAGVLLDRQLARLSGIDLTTIRYRRLDRTHGDRIDQAIHTLDAIADRIAFVRPPFDLANVAATADDFGADLIVLDYIQRIGSHGVQADQRSAVNATMSYLRQFADAGVAVLVVSAVGRTKDGGGRSSYDAKGLNLASFKESGELEYGADDAFLMTPDGFAGPDDTDPNGSKIRLGYLKARHGEARDIVLHFDRPRQRFIPIADDAADVPAVSKAERGRMRSALSAMWNRTPVADDDKGDGDES